MYKATTYQNHAAAMMNKTGKELVGLNCPSCGSKLVTRIRTRDGVKFVACDKKNRAYCKFSVGINETLRNRTKRISADLRFCSNERAYDAGMDAFGDVHLSECGSR